MSSRQTFPDPARVASALARLVVEDNLGIADYLPRMADEPFFLVAATGLGKTVVVPVHVWLVECARLADSKEMPTAWVVEPRVLIAEDQARYMESTMRRLMREMGHRDHAPLFGSVTSNGSYNPRAPIKFITTGVFTTKALAGDFRPGLDRVLIDEAHETIAQDADVEIALAVVRQSGVHVDYMSATVDTESIPRLLNISHSNVIVATNKRYPIFTVNAGQPLSDCLAEIVDDLLVHQNKASRFLPPLGYPQRQLILDDLFGGSPRSHALLVALNTVSGSRSDMAEAQQALAASSTRYDGTPIDVLELSSKQTGSELGMAQFNRIRTEIESSNRPYIVLATSVIEMGVTIPALDFVVTMDSGFRSITVGDRSLPQKVPLPFNSLKQRLGRVGRRRAGVGIIAREVGAPYTAYDVDELNSDALEYEPVRTPLASARLDTLALYTLRKGWASPTEVAAGLGAMKLPSSESLMTVTRLKDLVIERRALISLGAAQKGGLSPLGEVASSWVGTGWLPYAFALERSWSSDATPDEVSFWLASLALSDFDLGRTLLSNNVSVDEFNSRSAQSSAGIRFIDNLHAPLGRYDLVRAFFNSYASHLLGDRGLVAMRQLAEGTFARDCTDLDLNVSSMRRAMEAVLSARQQFLKRHRRDTRDINELVGPLPALTGNTRRRLIHAAHSLPGQVQVHVESVEDARPDDRAWVMSDGKAIASVSSAAPNISRDRTFTVRLQMRQEADMGGFWLDVVDHWAITP